MPQVKCSKVTMRQYLYIFIHVLDVKRQFIFIFMAFTIHFITLSLQKYSTRTFSTR